MSLHWHLTVN